MLAEEVNFTVVGVPVNEADVGSRGEEFTSGRMMGGDAFAELRFVFHEQTGGVRRLEEPFRDRGDFRLSLRVGRVAG